MNFDNIKPKDIKEFLNKRIVKAVGNYSYSSVMVLILYINNEPHILYTQRAFTLRHQPGDISFPGGHSEKDETPLETALRETEEELGIKREIISVLGQLDFFITPFNLHVTPFVGFIENIKVEDIKFSKYEVERVFTVPLKFFEEHKPLISTVHFQTMPDDNFPYDKIYNGQAYKWRQPKYTELFYDYNGTVIWGLTARITNHVCNLLSEINFQY